MSAPVDVLDECRAAIRARGYGITPWRLGREVGMRFAFAPRDEPNNPYTNPKSRRLFDSGVRYGVAQARKERAIAALARVGGAA